jgi:DNA-binding CsgD family transcriptional regulator
VPVVSVGSALQPELPVHERPVAALLAPASPASEVPATVQGQGASARTPVTTPEAEQARQHQTQHLEALLMTLLPDLTRLGASPLGFAPGTQDELLAELDCGQDHLLLVRRRTLLPVLPALPLLSPRELAIARLVARGLPNKSIGHLLDISPWTVATHLRRIFGKLQVASRAAMVAYLTRQHLL